MRRRPPRATRTDTLVPSTALVRSRFGIADRARADEYRPHPVPRTDRIDRPSHRLPFGGSVRVEAMAAILAPVGPVAWHQRDAQAIVRPQFGRRLAHRAAHAGEAQIATEEEIGSAHV